MMGRRRARRHPRNRGVQPSPASEAIPHDANGARPSGRFSVRLATCSRAQQTRGL